MHRNLRTKEKYCFCQKYIEGEYVSKTTNNINNVVKKTMFFQLQFCSTVQLKIKTFNSN